MSRIDGLLENKLVETVADLVRDFTELKNRQLTSGKSGVLGYVSENVGIAWDYDQTIVTSGGSAVSAKFELTFVRTDPQDYPIVRPFITLYVNGAPVTRNANGQLLYDDGTNLAQVASGNELLEKGSTVTNPSTATFTYDMTLVGTVHIQMKAYATSTSRGTVTLTRIS